MPSIAQTERFQNKKNFVGQRIKTCGYRFFKIIQTRNIQVPKLKQSNQDPQVRNQVRDKIIRSVDEYVHCLRAQHRGGQIPQYLTESVNHFKQQAYTYLAPQYVLEDIRLSVANKIFDHNYVA